MTNSPCDKNCPKRSATCHSTCKDYIEWSANLRRQRDEEYKERMVGVALNAIKFGKR